MSLTYLPSLEKYKLNYKNEVPFMEEAEVFRWTVKLTKYIDLFQGKMLPSIIVIVKESLFLTGQGF